MKLSLEWLCAEEAPQPVESALSIGNTAPCQIVRRNLYNHTVAAKHTNTKPTHLATQVGKDLMVLVGHHLEGSTWEHFHYGAFHLNAGL
jgi:hypothetical protein